ncbi:MAG: alpha/beta hydrolase, partial [Sphingomicrobium sp.]
MHQRVPIDGRIRRVNCVAARWIATAAVLGAALAILTEPAAAKLAAGPSAPSQAVVTTPAGDSARSVAIGGGRTMYLICRGRGSPTVVLVSGLGERADNWDLTIDPNASARAVFPQVGRFSRVCAYDRPGTETTTAAGREESRSTPVPQPTSGSAAAGDLAAMLAAAKERGPYVLVGHSYGGDVVRLFATAHPREVAGLVLVDALSEDLPTRLTPEQSADLERLN